MTDGVIDVLHVAPFAGAAVLEPEDAGCYVERSSAARRRGSARRMLDFARWKVRCELRREKAA